MKITLELDVKFDDPVEEKYSKVKSEDVADAVSYAVSECEGIESIGSVKVTKIEIIKIIAKVRRSQS